MGLGVEVDLVLVTLAELVLVSLDQGTDLGSEAEAVVELEAAVAVGQVPDHHHRLGLDMEC